MCGSSEVDPVLGLILDLSPELTLFLLLKLLKLFTLGALIRLTVGGEGGEGGALV